MTGRDPTLHVLTPHYKPNGGVVKLMDYVVHALSDGYQVSIWSRERPSPDLPLFANDRYRHLLDEPRVSFHSDPRLAICDRDLVLVSLPRDYEVAYRSLPFGMSPERIIHIIQNVRHANPCWSDGYALRLLTRPAARISTNQVIYETIRPWLDERGYNEVINLGHDVDFFHVARSEALLSTPLRVAHTTWKSSIGDVVEEKLAGEPYVFRSVRDHVGWADLRELYHWADVFLCTPEREEGVYMPAIEAMAAGCIVITPDVGGNRSYCRPGQNCVGVDYGSAAAYSEALRAISRWDADRVTVIREAAYRSVSAFDLGAEQQAFHDFCGRLWKRIDSYEARTTSDPSLTGSD